jgi:hypothetical protein
MYTCSFTGNADVLTGEAPTHTIHFAFPRSPIEFLYVSINRKFGQDSIGLALLQHLLTIGINLDRTDWLVAQKHTSEDASTHSSEQVHLTHFAVSP